MAFSAKGFSSISNWNSICILKKKKINCAVTNAKKMYNANNRNELNKFASKNLRIPQRKQNRKKQKANTFKEKSLNQLYLICLHHHQTSLSTITLNTNNFRKRSMFYWIHQRQESAYMLSTRCITSQNIIHSKSKYLLHWLEQHFPLLVSRPFAQFKMKSITNTRNSMVKQECNYYHHIC